jgi:hypothetical protein
MSLPFDTGTQQLRSRTVILGWLGVYVAGGMVGTVLDVWLDLWAPTWAMFLASAAVFIRAVVLALRRPQHRTAALAAAAVVALPSTPLVLHNLVRWSTSLDTVHLSVYLFLAAPLAALAVELAVGAWNRRGQRARERAATRADWDAQRQRAGANRPG